MSDQNVPIWRSGWLPRSQISGFWSPDIRQADPEIPRLPIELAAGIIALCFGYAEAVPAVEIEDSYVAQVIEAPAAPASDIPWYVVTDPEDEAETPDSVTEPLPAALLAPVVEEYIPTATLTDLEPERQIDAYSSVLLHIAAPAAPPEADIPLPALTDPEEPEPLLDAVIAYQFEDDALALTTVLPDEDDYLVEPVADSVVLSIFEDAPAPDLTQIPPPVVAELDEPVWVESYSAHLLHLEAPAPGDLTQIPIPALTDPEDAEELADSLIAYQFEDDALALTVDMPDGDEPAEIEESLVYQVYDAAAPPDLTLVPGWQDDFLRVYEDEREEQDQAALLGMVFDPYGQVDDPPPVVPVSSEMIIRARRRGRR